MSIAIIDKLTIKELTVCFNLLHPCLLQFIKCFSVFKGKVDQGNYSRQFCISQFKFQPGTIIYFALCHRLVETILKRGGNRRLGNNHWLLNRYYSSYLNDSGSR